MPYTLDDKLVVGISSRALFDLTAADAVYRAEGLAGYRAYQREREDEPLLPGTGFSLAKHLLAINERARPERLVEVVIISRNDADSAMRVINSIQYHGLDIARGAFRNGRDPLACLQPFRCNLFLSAEPDDVAGATEKGFPAGLVLAPPDSVLPDDPSEVRIAFDGDAVLFSDESERVFAEGGLDAFLEHERRLTLEPMQPGPFRPFLQALARLQQHFGEDDSPIRTALVTSRNAPADKRVVVTLRAWNIRIDETYFLGGMDKAEMLQVFSPHIFFDDQKTHLTGARASTPSAQVLAPRAVEHSGLALFTDAEAPKVARPRRKKRLPLAEKRTSRSTPEATSGKPSPLRADILGAMADDRDGQPDAGSEGTRRTSVVDAKQQREP